MSEEESDRTSALRTQQPSWPPSVRGRSSSTRRADPARVPGARTRPMTHPLSLMRHLRLHRSEQRSRIPRPEDAGRADAGPAEPRQASDQRGRLILAPQRARRSDSCPDAEHVAAGLPRRSAGGQRVSAQALTAVPGSTASPAVRRQRPKAAAPAACHRRCSTAGGGAAFAAPGRRSRPHCAADASQTDGRSRWSRR